MLGKTETINTKQQLTLLPPKFLVYACVSECVRVCVCVYQYLVFHEEKKLSSFYETNIYILICIVERMRKIELLRKRTTDTNSTF